MRDAGVGLAETVERLAGTDDALARAREARAARGDDQQLRRRAQATRLKADAEQDEARHLRRVFGSATG